MKVIFAPDWRSGVPYQRLLADSLIPYEVEVEFLENYKRVMPLTRLLKEKKFEILHLHWPEAYFPQRGGFFDWLRGARFSTDLSMATRGHGLVVTAHNLAPHN